MDDAVAYKGAIVADAATGKVLFEDRADVVTPPASMAKLMTFAVAYDRLASGHLLGGLAQAGHGLHLSQLAE